MEDFIKQDLYSLRDPKSGIITQQKLDTWLQKYGHALKKFGLQDKFKTLESATNQLEDAAGFQKEFSKSQASKTIGTDLDKYVEKMLGTSKKAEEVRNLKRMFKGDPKALAGLQNSLVDQVVYSNIADGKLRTFDKMNKQFIKYGDAINEAFKETPEKLRALKKYREAIETLETLNKPPTIPGSPTKEFMSIADQVAKVAGLGNNWIGTVYKTVQRFTTKNSEDAMKAMLNRAAVDPDFAYSLMHISKRTPKKAVDEKIKGHLIALGFRETTKDNK